MPVNPGDVVHIDGARRARVVSVIPAVLIGEFVEQLAFGVLEVDEI